ncbi:MAG: hypothetical protein ABDH66_02145 [Bacteroidia bacterium]
MIQSWANLLANSCAYIQIAQRAEKKLAFNRSQLVFLLSGL